MRPSRTVARAALTAVLALGALPGLVGSSEPSPARPIDAAAFRQVNLATTRDPAGNGPLTLDAEGRSAGALRAADPLAEAGGLASEPSEGRPQPVGGGSRASWQWRAPRYTVTGFASFYDNGTTAMRIPRGTVIVICGGGGCIQRVVNDYGPSKAGGRVIDMYRPDFFAICGCGWWSGTTEVTIRVY